MAFTVGKYGFGSLANLLALMAGFYITAIFFILVVLGGIARVAGFSILRFLAYIKDELLLVLGTSSSETALPGMIQKMRRLGCAESTVGLVIPTGYSFNLDGTNIYMSMAAIFLAQATNTPLDLQRPDLAARRGDDLLERRKRRDRRGLCHAGRHARRRSQHSDGQSLPCSSASTAS